MGRDLLPYISEVPRIVNERTTNWTAGPSPNIGWARRVYPDLEPEAALDKLWDQVVHVLPAGHGRPRASVARADGDDRRKRGPPHRTAVRRDPPEGARNRPDDRPAIQLEVAGRRLRDGRRHHALPEPAHRGGLHDPGSRARRRPRVGHDAPRDVRVVSSTGSGSSSRAVVRCARTRTWARTRSAGRSRRTTALRASASSRSSIARGGSARSGRSSTTPCSTRTRPATSRSATRTRSRSRTRPSASA